MGTVSLLRRPKPRLDLQRLRLPTSAEQQPVHGRPADVHRRSDPGTTPDTTSGSNTLQQLCQLREVVVLHGQPVQSTHW
jgi:hypothetical protein